VEANCLWSTQGTMVSYSMQFIMLYIIILKIKKIGIGL